MWARCIAYLANGHVCLQPAEYLDPRRKGMVCVDHRPAPAEWHCADVPLGRELASVGIVERLLVMDWDIQAESAYLRDPSE